MNNKIQELLRKTLGDIDCEEIVLFGSRARYDFIEKSDHDILVILKETFTIKEKMRVSGLLRKDLARVGIDADIIIKSKEEINYYRDKIGSVVRNALKDGVAL